jgi:hypothetical protein
MTVQEQFKVNGVQYRLQTRRCGKKGCKCNMGEEHGPYWYGYSDHGPAKYVGAQLPENVTKHLQLLKAAKPKLKNLRSEILDRMHLAERALEKARRELRTLDNLEAGEYTASEVLKDLGLSQLNGQGGG